MEKTSLSLTVYFEEPFWRGLYERWTGEFYEVCKVTYGAEPKDQVLYETILDNGERLLDFSPTQQAAGNDLGRNPKRRQRQVAKKMRQVGVGTKAQQALKAQQELKAAELKQERYMRKAAEQERRFALHQAKRKARHNGH